jgi:DNA-binding response OmpR family regulator
MGCPATFVIDPAKALDAAASIGAEITFLDLGMPGISGYELPYGEAMVLVAATGYGAFADRIKGAMRGSMRT